MKKAPTVLACVVMLVSAANAAEPRYDHNLEAAAARIAAAKMGDIRGGFSFREKPKFVVVQSIPSATAVDVLPSAGRPDDGLAPSVRGQPNSFLN